MAARRRTRPLVVIALVVLIGVVAGGAAWANHEPKASLALGDRGQVVARVDGGCRSLSIRVDGLALSGKAASIPEAWRGRRITGDLELTRRSSEKAVRGVFRSDDGHRVAVGGGRDGEMFFTLACWTWE